MTAQKCTRCGAGRWHPEVSQCRDPQCPLTTRKTMRDQRAGTTQRQNMAPNNR